ncbi:unnamed protein product [Didymodactylos carnosus]|uniref:Epidermal growth factor receptor substrate 15-like 1 n=1 Tax=Didymodactylos carnosus TaxID=1234261 RepID=A0A813SQ73_9BILA|nr:unnamed protein product [Didymodactylos carnosus]CAF0891547.1 unnamed protein product [Didymodactylos carnosus]CAF3584451.1 unnamed protein product [Didymodactylos carnosus]CAF3673685.1 unnamed protein product [Didymodactylos carnosus]
MATIESTDLDKMIGTYQFIYEYYFSQADSNGQGITSSIESSSYFNRSNLKPEVLKDIWSLVDPTGKGYLDRRTFYIALKLISLAQNNLQFNYENLYQEVAPPTIGEIPQSVLMSVDDSWHINATLRCTFDRAFDKLCGNNNKLPGSQVKTILLKSGLSADLLHRIWDLSDYDQDGALDREEFAIAMFLIQRIKQGLSKELPDKLPVNLLPLKVRLTSGDTVGGLSLTLTAISPKKNEDHWIVSPEEKQRSDVLFQSLDTDKDGFLAGSDVFQTFLASGLPSFVLSHIWNLCDIGQTGKLNSEQFALAVYLINQKIKGNYNIPVELTMEMMPPSLRPKTFHINESDNQELQRLLNEVSQLTNEKSLREIQLNERDQLVKQKRSELASLEFHVETVVKTLNERELRKTEKKNALSDFEEKKRKAVQYINELKQQISMEEQAKQVQQKLHASAVEYDIQKQNDSRIKNNIDQLKMEKNSLESKLMTKQQTLTQLTRDLEKFRYIVQNQQKFLTDYINSNGQQAITELILKFQQATTLSNSLPSVSATPPPQTIPLSTSTGKMSASNSMTSGFRDQTNHFIPNFQTPSTSSNSQAQGFSADPFGLTTTSTGSTLTGTHLHADDPFSSSTKNDPFISSVSSVGGGTHYTDGSDPFQQNGSNKFSTTHDLIKKSMMNRSKTPNPNMFNLNPLTKSEQPQRPQSAMDSALKQGQAPSQAFNDLLDIFS